MEFIKERDTAFFVGSGISFDPPSMLPSWTEVTEEAIKSLCSEGLKNEQKELISRSGNIRPEVLIDIMRGVIGDKAIGILDVLKSEDFSMNHVFLAYVILNHNVPVITTNYDESIEAAAKRIFRREIPHVYYDEKGFSEWLNSKEKPAALFKLHSTISRKASIKVALSQVAAGGLSESMRELLKNFSENYHILFWGYSLTDDFDIVPVLFKTQPKEVTWIIYRKDSEIPEHREKIQEKLNEEEKELEVCLVKLLRGGLSPNDRAKIQKEKYDHQKKANYMRLFLKARDFGTESYSLKLPIPFWEDFQGLLSNERRKKARKFFNQWSAEINEWDRSLIGAEIFFYLREERGSLQKVIDLCDKAINILKMQGDNAHPEKLIHAYFLKGWAHRLLGTKEDNEKAIESFEQTESLFEKLPFEEEKLPLELLNMKGELLHQKGVISQRKGDSSSALQCLDKALKIRHKLGDKANIAFSEFQKFMIKEDKYKGKYPPNYIDYMMNLKDQLTEAQKELNKRGEIGRASTLLHNIAFIHQRLGGIEIERGPFEQGEKQLIIAINQYNEAIERRKLVFDVGGITMARSRLAQCHCDLAQLALNQGKRKQALYEINKARKHVEEASEIYARMGDLYRQGQVEKTKERINELESKIKEAKYEKNNCI